MTSNIFFLILMKSLYEGLIKTISLLCVGVEVSRGLDDDNATVVTLVFPNVMLTIKTITFTRLSFLLSLDDSLKGRE